MIEVYSRKRDRDTMQGRIDLAIAIGLPIELADTKLTSDQIREKYRGARVKVGG